MHKAQLMCKVYYAVDVKHIMPPNEAGGVDKHPTHFIIRILIRVEISQPKPGSGGHDAYLDPERSQMRQPARARHPEFPSRKSHRCAVSGTPFLRPTRSAAGQIRNAKKSQDRWVASWGNGNWLRFLTGVAISTPQTLRDRWVGWVAASMQRTSKGSQAIRRCADLCSGDIESRTRTAYCELATTRGQGIWNLSPSPQYRKSAGTASKKGRSAHAGSDEPHPVTIRRMEECTLQYEILRRQVLEDGKISNGNALEITFIECRGLAAWLSYVPPGATSADLQTAESESPGSDLIVALADLVLGNRLEEKDDPRC